MAPLEPQAKVLISEEFLSTTHGEIACEDCHGGNPVGKRKPAAHEGIDPLPSVNDPDNACGECHDEIVATVKESLHATLATFQVQLSKRANMDQWKHIDKARQNHCAACHTSCGGCHVSRPPYAKKGFVNGHMFQSRPDPVNQCTACHGSRVGYEYYGQRGQGDVHAAKAGMDCVDCHGAGEMHAAAPGDIEVRYDLKEMKRCEDCHEQLQAGSVREHAIHKGKVQCQVCHSQSYVNCYSCHVGKDKEGTAYFQNKWETETMKIGRNYGGVSDRAAYQYMLVRHVPTDPVMFDFYGKGGFTSFNNKPTWKRTSPHNIQRRTWQAAACNNCHGNRDLFLSKNDLLDYEIEANQQVVVSDRSLPIPVANSRTISVETSHVRSNMVVEAGWLQDNLLQDDLLIIDARNAAAYEKGHIPGAILFDPMTAGLRTSAESKKLFVLLPHRKISDILGGKGIMADDHIVVYDRSGSTAGALIAVLEWAGATRVSYLNGGIEGWHHTGFHMSTEVSTRKARSFKGTEQAAWIENNARVARLLEKPGTVVVDSRLIDRRLGLTRHEKAGRSGFIPGSINIPLGAFYMDNGFLKSPDELLWMLETYGITPKKTVITTCDTGVAAANAFFVLRYVGFSDVRVHDEAWVNWSRTR